MFDRHSALAFNPGREAELWALSNQMLGTGF